ncbi:hypothetical protein GCM10025876_06930 [Demequina litorisediminis]|uniref:Uncharacterized protein n=1 Tax=Demequina litorisediminis TaxID=1849022 RepID=A0ABQ6IA27_9MICO|nr:hypothetical protein GCM10025876_06930 [Demequina litorisediminis]
MVRLEFCYGVREVLADRSRGESRLFRDGDGAEAVDVAHHHARAFARAQDGQRGGQHGAVGHGVGVVGCGGLGHVGSGNDGSCRRSTVAVDGGGLHRSLDEGMRLVERDVAAAAAEGPHQRVLQEILRAVSVTGQRDRVTEQCRTAFAKERVDGDGPRSW